MKNTYFINTEHTVYIDDFNEGEGNQVNFYQMKETIKAHSPKEAIQEYFNNTLYLPFDFEKAYIYHKEDETEQPKNTLQYSFLVDSENEQPSETDISDWKEGKKELFVNNTFLSIYQLTEVTL